MKSSTIFEQLGLGAERSGTIGRFRSVNRSWGVGWSRGVGWGRFVGWGRGIGGGRSIGWGRGVGWGRGGSVDRSRGRSVGRSGDGNWDRGRGVRGHPNWSGAVSGLGWLKAGLSLVLDVGVVLLVLVDEVVNDLDGAVGQVDAVLS